jgi:hypothetical protein
MINPTLFKVEVMQFFANLLKHGSPSLSFGFRLFRGLLRLVLFLNRLADGSYHAHALALLRFIGDVSQTPELLPFVPIGIRLDGGNPLARIGDVEYRILIRVKRYKSCSLCGCKSDLDILVCQAGTEIAESDSDEITFTPIGHELTRCQVFQRSRDFAPGNGEVILHILNIRSPITS